MIVTPLILIDKNYSSCLDRDKARQHGFFSRYVDNQVFVSLSTGHLYIYRRQPGNGFALSYYSLNASTGLENTCAKLGFDFCFCKNALYSVDLKGMVRAFFLGKCYRGKGGGIKAVAFWQVWPRQTTTGMFATTVSNNADESKFSCTSSIFGFWYVSLPSFARDARVRRWVNYLLGNSEVSAAEKSSSVEQF